MKKMTNKLVYSLIFLLDVLLSACTTSNTITEYDDSGRVVKVTHTSESLAKTITKSTQNKSLFLYDNSFLAFLSASMSTTEDPTPTIKFGFGKADKGLLSLHKDHSIQDASKLIQNAREQDVSLSATGVNVSNGVDSQFK